MAALIAGERYLAQCVSGESKCTRQYPGPDLPLTCWWSPIIFPSSSCVFGMNKNRSGYHQMFSQTSPSSRVFFNAVVHQMDDLLWIYDQDTRRGCERWLFCESHWSHFFFRRQQRELQRRHRRNRRRKNGNHVQRVDSGSKVVQFSSWRVLF